MRKKKWYEHEYDAVSYAGHGTPYFMVLIGIIGLICTPINTNNLVINEGKLIAHGKSSYSHKITIQNDSIETDYIIGLVKNRKQSISKLSDIKYVKVWVRKRYPKNAVQLEADGEVIIPYSWWIQTSFFWGFIVIGSILIPVAERSYRKWRKDEDKKDMEYYIQQAKKKR